MSVKGKMCFFEMGWADDEHHVIPRSARPDLVNCKKNKIPTSREAHDIIHRGTREQMERLPNWDKYLRLMREIDENYYNRFIHLRK
jgi:hypothetical protein